MRDIKTRLGGWGRGKKHTNQNIFLKNFDNRIKMCNFVALPFHNKDGTKPIAKMSNLRKTLNK